MIIWLKMLYTIMLADLKEFFRVRLIIVSSCVMPVLMTIAFGFGMNDQKAFNVENYFLFIFPAILALGTMFSSMFSGGYVIILDRQQSVIRDLILSPVTYSTYIIARIFSCVLKALPQLIASSLLALLFLKSFTPHCSLFIILSFILTSVLFSTIGMIIGSFSNVVTFPGLANIILMPSMYLCDVFFPIENFKEFSLVVKAIPFTPSVQLFRYGFTGKGDLAAASINLGMLLAYALVTILFWVWFFKKQMMDE